MAKKGFRIDLNKIENLQFAMHRYSDVARERIRSTVEQWARETKGNYDALAGYGSRLQGKQSFYSVVDRNGGNGLTAPNKYGRKRSQCLSLHWDFSFL